MNTITSHLLSALYRYGNLLALTVALSAVSFAHADVSTPQATNDATTVTYQMSYTGTRQYSRIYLDTDRSPTSGFSSGGIGANYLLENGSLYRYSGSGGTAWGWTRIKSVTYSNSNGVVKWTVARSDLDSPAGLDLAGQVDPPRETTAKVTQILAPMPTATSDSVNTSYTLFFSGTPSFVRIFLDTDKAAATGYRVGSLGADYLIENRRLYRYSGTSGNWGWTYVKPAAYTQGAGTATLTVARTDIGSPETLNFIAQSTDPLVTSAVMNQVLSYTASNDIIANPERGLYNSYGSCNDRVRGVLNKNALQERRANGESLVICVFYLSEFKTSPVSATTLSFFQQQMNTVREAGVKVLVRFAYTDNRDGVDASLSQVQAHMDQFAPYFAQNSDVMFVMQEGWIGAWGEGAFSTNFGNSDALTSQNIEDRNAVLVKLLQVLPANRMVQIRTPYLKTLAFGAQALQSSESFNGSAKARTGHHNDCFLRNLTDSGTYRNPSLEYPYLAQETMYLPMGGETCGLDVPAASENRESRTSCPIAMSEMRLFHWSYLNLNYHPDVILGWRNQGCFDQINKSLGYRFVLQSGAYSASGKPGGSINVSFSLKNVGWAAPFNARGVYLVLRNTATGALVRLPLDTDPRRWLAGDTAITVTQAVTLPADMASGNYAAFLSLPDAAPALAGRPEYAIQLANTSTWEAATGLNSLGYTISVAP